MKDGCLFVRVLFLRVLLHARHLRAALQAPIPSLATLEAFTVSEQVVLLPCSLLLPSG